MASAQDLQLRIRRAKLAERITAARAPAAEMSTREKLGAMGVSLDLPSDEEVLAAEETIRPMGALTVGGLGGLGLAGKLGFGALGRIASVGAGTGAVDAGIQAAETGAVDPKRLALETGFGMLGQGIGEGAGALANRFLAPDIGRLDPAAANALKAKGEAAGITLTPAELTNLPSLKAQQKALGNLPQSADTLDDFYLSRFAAVDDAVNRQLDAISPVRGAEQAGEMARKGADAAMKRIAAERAATASPLYKRAFAEAPEVNIKPVLDGIDKKLKIAKGPIKKALTSARELLMDGDLPDTRLEALHQSKLALDDMIEGARESGLGNTAKRQLVETKKALLEALDGSSPTYKSARDIFADLSPETSKVREGVLGVIADLPDMQLQKAASKLFAPTSLGPDELAYSAKLLKTEAPDAWQAIKRAYLEDAWIKAGKETLQGPGNQGAKFRKAIFGDRKQRELIETALEPAEFGALSDLAEVLEATGRVKPVGSDTAWNQEVMKTMRETSAPWIVRALRFASADIGKQVSDALIERGLAKNAARIAEVITSPQAMDRLRDLKALTASDRVRLFLLGQLLIDAGEAVLPAPPDRAAGESP